ncbi:HINT domain-containing protein [Moraxella catarrhalis]
MTLLDKHGLPNVTILSQTKLTHTDTVYNFEVQDFHTYHIGEFGVWVHNAECCGVLSDIDRWSEIRQSVKPPHPRHKIDQIAKTQAKTKNTVVSSKVDMNKDIELIRQGLGTPKKGSSGEIQIEINGRTYQKHAGGGVVESDRLIPISSNAKGEIFELSRGEYINLREIVRNGGDIAKSKAQMSRRKDFNQKDFNKAVEVYNETR